jgi:glycosyltransferase involved in cell wall biosynthesis
LKPKQSLPLLIDALYVNNSGGLMLLKYLAEKAMELKPGVFFLIDSRCADAFKSIPDAQIQVMKAGISQRKAFYIENRDRFSGVFCFGNIPPPFRLKVPVYTYLHNLLLLSTPPGYPFRQKVSKFLKTFFIRRFLKNTDGIFVQTALMAQLLKEKWHYPEEKIRLFPFYDVRRFAPIKETEKKADEYLFLNDGNPHKNHVNLLKAWELVNHEQPGWRLHLTVTGRHPQLIDLIETYIRKGVNIINHGFVDPVKAYSECQYLVYPSLTESFGLALIEGATAGLQVISSDLPYAHLVIEPSAVFNPMGPEDIARVILNNRIGNSHFRPTKLIATDQIREMLTMWE